MCMELYYPPKTQFKVMKAGNAGWKVLNKVQEIWRVEKSVRYAYRLTDFCCAMFPS